MLAHPDDLLVWSDGTSCYREELPTMSHMSDDYQVISAFSPYYDDADEIIAELTQRNH